MLPKEAHTFVLLFGGEGRKGEVVQARGALSLQISHKCCTLIFSLLLSHLLLLEKHFALFQQQQKNPETSFGQALKQLLC